MELITDEQRKLLARNGRVRDLDRLLGRPPVVKLFTPDAAATWLLSATDPEDADRAWGLCDPGLGSPEIGWVSLAELALVRGRLGMEIERDDSFRPTGTLGAYANVARRSGFVIA